MTERGATQLRRSGSALGIGPSILEADASKLTLAIEERSPLTGGRVAGTML